LQKGKSCNCLKGHFKEVNQGASMSRGREADSLGREGGKVGRKGCKCQVSQEMRGFFLARDSVRRIGRMRTTTRHLRKKISFLFKKGGREKGGRQKQFPSLETSEEQMSFEGHPEFWPLQKKRRRLVAGTIRKKKKGGTKVVYRGNTTASSP